MARNHFLIAGAVAVGLAIGVGLLAIGHVMKPSMASSDLPPGVCVPGGICTAPDDPPAADATTSILFVGDLMFDRQVAEFDKGNPSTVFSSVGKVKAGAFGTVDIAVGNLEGPVTSERRPPVKSIDFAFDPAVAPALKQEGFDAVSQANNHSLDQGRAGADDSRTYLSAAGVGVFGDETHDDPATAITTVSVTGTKIALVGLNDTETPLTPQEVSTDIAAAKTQAPVVIVFMHWGVEYTAKPTARQVSLAHEIIDDGADAVIGSHPHWMQSAEVYDGRPIVYSLGNFVFDQEWSAETEEGLAVRFDIGPTSRDLAFYPVHLTDAKPSVEVGTARNARLTRLASLSDPSLKTGILQGELSFPD